MTGFGAATLESRGVVIRAEIRSVNHKHLQAKVRLPYELSHLEPDAEATVRKRLSRGSIQVGIRLHREGSSAAAEIDNDLLEAYARRTSKAAKKLGVEPLRLAELLSLPGVVEPPSVEVEDPGVARLVVRALDQATRELVRMREEEGAALAADLERCRSGIERVTARIAKRMPKVVRKHHETLQERVARLTGDASIPATDLARELALLADRLDVSEELARLESHLDQLGRLLEKGGTVGRKLEFLAQEFLREANTIGSKASDAKVAHDVIELKTLIERLREQVLNVE